MLVAACSWLLLSSSGLMIWNLADHLAKFHIISRGKKDRQAPPPSTLFTFITDAWRYSPEHCFTMGVAAEAKDELIELVEFLTAPQPHVRDSSAHVSSIRWLLLWWHAVADRLALLVDAPRISFVSPSHARDLTVIVNVIDRIMKTMNPRGCAKGVQ